jgi:hypothetical protein
MRRRILTKTRMTTGAGIAPVGDDDRRFVGRRLKDAALEERARGNVPRRRKD